MIRVKSANAAQSVLNRKSEIVNSRSEKLYSCRESSTNSPFYAKQTQSCPPPADSKPFIWQRLTKIMALPHDPKANPNKPKRTQNEPKTNPIFGPPEPPKAKANPNKPKTKPIYRGPAGCEAGTNPIMPAQPAQADGIIRGRRASFGRMRRGRGRQQFRRRLAVRCRRMVLPEAVATGRRGWQSL